MPSLNPFIGNEPTPEVEPSHIPGPAMALLVGALNTEAKCITYSAIPDEPAWTPVTDIRKELETNSAYKLVVAKRFNIQGILRGMDGLLTNVINDPLSENQTHKLWTQKREPLGPVATGIAGLLLDYSLTHHMPLRRILGEQRTVRNVNSTEIRLGILCTCASMAKSESVIDKNTAAEAVYETNEIKRDAFDGHIGNLVNAGLLSETGNRLRRKLEFTKLPSNYEALEVTIALLSTIGRVATNPATEAQRGRRLGQQIATNPSVVPQLILRSYESTTHTGKLAPRKKKNR